MKDSPFKATYGYWVDAESRLDCVKSFNVAECHAALKVYGLQKTVSLAIERRLRKVKKEIAKGRRCANPVCGHEDRDHFGGKDCNQCRCSRYRKSKEAA